MQYFKKYNNENNEDIKRYCEKLFKIDVDNIYTISANELNDLKQKYEANISKIKPLQQLKKKNYIKLVIIVLAILLSFVALFVFIQDKKDTAKIKTNNVETKESQIILEPIEEAKKKETRQRLPKVKAVVGEEVLIGTDWYKVGDRYRGYQIRKITLEYIELEYRKKLVKVYRVND